MALSKPSENLKKQEVDELLDAREKFGGETNKDLFV
jgi:hypothetical protein